MMKWILALSGLGMLCGALLLAGLFAFGVPFDGVHVIVNDQELRVNDVAGWHGAAAALALMLALGALLLAVPLLLLVGVVLPLLLVVGAVVLAAGLVLGAGALTLSPLIALILLVWWLSRRSARRQAPPAGPMPAP